MPNVEIFTENNKSLPVGAEKPGLAPSCACEQLDQAGE